MFGHRVGRIGRTLVTIIPNQCRQIDVVKPRTPQSDMFHARLRQLCKTGTINHVIHKHTNGFVPLRRFR